MNVDDLFPEDDQGDDHPIMKLFANMDEQRDSFLDAISKALGTGFQFVDDKGNVVFQHGVVDTDQDQPATLSGQTTKEKGRTT